MVRKQIPKARAFSRNTSLDRVEVKNNIDLSLFLHIIPLLRIFRMFLLRHIPLTPNKGHCKFFRYNPSTIGWRKPKSLKDHLISGKIKYESQK